MRQIDHNALAVYLLYAFKDRKPSRHRAAFRIGAVEPDLNPFTYIRGTFVAAPFHGHHSQNSRKHIGAVMRKLSQKEKLSLFDYFRLGTLIHYVSDSFTHSHNDTFKGTIKEHVQYEWALHSVMEDKLKCADIPQNDAQKEDLWRFFLDAHRDYIAQIPSAQTDCWYILSVCFCIYSGILMKNRADFQYSR